jgi:carbonic anhydrase
MKTTDKEFQNSITPGEALDILKAGNQRFVNNLKINRNLLQQVNETKTGQYPIAAVLSCIDSRTSAELIFDQGLGDIFSIRIAGNVLNDDVLGSMEFAGYYAGVKAILVLGHTNCGAVNSAYKGVKMGYLTQLLNKIQPVVALTMAERHEHNQNDFVDRVAENNVRMTAKSILRRSKIISSLVSEGKLKIAGGMYDVESGHVSFFEPEVDEEELVLVAKHIK